MDLVNISLSTAAVAALLGYLVVFVGLILLMLVIIWMSKFFISKKKAAEPAPAAAPAAAAPAAEVKKPEAHGTAGELKLYDTDPKDAAMIMAIVADTLGKPLNQLRFISIKEVKE